MKKKSTGFLIFAVVVSIGLVGLTAWRISSGILESHNSLRNSLTLSSEQFEQKNQQATQEILDAIEAEPGPTSSQKQAQIDLILAESHALLEHLEGHIAQLESIGEKDPETGLLTNMKETEKNGQYWLGNTPDPQESDNTAAYVLRAQLDQYVSWANQFVVDSLGVTDSETYFEYITAGVSFSEASWEYRTFHQKPVIADLAMLEKFKLDITSIEEELMSLTASK